MHLFIAVAFMPDDERKVICAALDIADPLPTGIGWAEAVRIYDPRGDRAGDVPDCVERMS